MRAGARGRGRAGPHRAACRRWARRRSAAGGGRRSRRSATVAHGAGAQLHGDHRAFAVSSRLAQQRAAASLNAQSTSDAGPERPPHEPVPGGGRRRGGEPGRARRCGSPRRGRAGRERQQADELLRSNCGPRRSAGSTASAPPRSRSAPRRRSRGWRGARRPARARRPRRAPRRARGCRPWSRRRRRRPPRRSRTARRRPTPRDGGGDVRLLVEAGKDDGQAEPQIGRHGRCVGIGRRRSWRPCWPGRLSRPQAPVCPSLRRVGSPLGDRGDPVRPLPCTPAVGARILLVEDDDDLRDVMADGLAAEGHDVRAGPTARPRWSARGRRHELVLLDLGLGPRDRTASALPPPARIRPRPSSWSSPRAATRPTSCWRSRPAPTTTSASPSASPSCAAGCGPRSGASPSRRSRRRAGRAAQRRPRARRRRADGPLGGRRAAAHAVGVRRARGSHARGRRRALPRRARAGNLRRRRLRHPRAIDVHVHHLREKLSEAGGDPAAIATVRGAGYRLAA